MTGGREVDGQESTLAVAGDEPSASRSEPVSPLEPGARIGRFTVLDTIGSGAMGVVIAAHDPDLDRQVAVKIVRPHALGPEGNAEARTRLLREARAMARLSHPNILTVYEAGTFGEEVFIAMEYAPGGTLRTWGATRRPWRQVVDLHAQAGRGLWAAHQENLVHRDYKPDNVLLAESGGARVADFGLVGVEVDTAGDVASRQLGVTLTQTGSLVGTPAYMAPEQHRREPATAASDQFAFCVALYEALYGERPFTGKTYGELYDNVLAGRFADPAKRAKVPSRVRALLLRGLSVDPADRFPSMGALLSALDRARRGRRGWAVAAVAVIAAGAIGAGVLARGGDSDKTACNTGMRQLAGVWDDSRRAQVRDAFLALDEPYARDSWKRVEAALDAYAASWAERFDAVCEDTLVEAAESEKVLAMRMSCLADRKRDLGALTAVLAEADESVVRRATSAVAMLAGVEACNDVDALRPGYEPPPDDKKDAVAALRVRLARAEALDLSGRYAEGLQLAERAVADAKALGYAPVVAEALNQLGRLHKSSGNYGDAEKFLEEAVWAADAAGHEYIRARAATLLIWIVGRSGRQAERIRWTRLAEVAVNRAEGPGGPLEYAYLTNIGASLNAKGDYDEAIAHLQQAVAIGDQALGPEHPYVAAALDNLGISWAAKGEYERALEQQQRSMEIRERTLGPEHPSLAGSYDNLGGLYRSMGKYEEAVESHRTGIALAERGLGRDHPDLALMINNLGEAYRWQDAFDDALECYQRALRIWERTLEPGHPYLAGGASNVGLALLGLNRPAEAVEYFERAVAACDDDCPRVIVAEASFGLARALRRTGGDRARAVALAKRAREVWESMPDAVAKDSLRDVDAFMAGR